MKTLEILQTGQIWNSLEIIKLVVSALSPIIIAFLAFYFNKIIKQLEKKQWTNQKIVEKRIEIYDKVVPKLNDILCFYCYKGNWKEITPEDIIRLKRELDKDIHIYAPLFSDSLKNEYDEFIYLCFKTFSKEGHNAKIKSSYEKRKENAKWEDEWVGYFDTNDVDGPKAINDKYVELMKEFKKDLVIFQSGYYPAGAVPQID